MGQNFRIIYLSLLGNPSYCNKYISTSVHSSMLDKTHLKQKVVIVHFEILNYSETSINDPSEKRPTSLQRPNYLPPIHSSIELMYF